MWYTDCQQGHAGHVHGGIPTLLINQLPLHDYPGRPRARVSSLVGKDCPIRWGEKSAMVSREDPVLCPVRSLLAAFIPKDSVDGTGVKFWLHTFTAWI